MLPSFIDLSLSDLIFINLILCICILDFGNLKLRKRCKIKGFPIYKLRREYIDRVIDFVLSWIFFTKINLQVSDKCLMKQVKLWLGFRIDIYLNHWSFAFLFIFDDFLVHLGNVEIFYYAFRKGLFVCEFLLVVDELWCVIVVHEIVMLYEWFFHVIIFWWLWFKYFLTYFAPIMSITCLFTVDLYSRKEWMIAQINSHKIFLNVIYPRFWYFNNISLQFWYNTLIK